MNTFDVDRAATGPVNLQLPKIKFNSQQAKLAAIVPPEPRIKFNTEKTTANANASVSSFVVKRDPGESEFKKRKICENDSKKNLRTRTEEDDWLIVFFFHDEE